MRNVLTVAVMIGLVGTAAFSADTGNETAVRLAAFREAVSKDLQALVQTSVDWADAESGLPLGPDRSLEDLTKRFREARNGFEGAVMKHWPFERPASDESSGSRSAASEALFAAMAFERNDYRNRQSDREATAAKYVAVADEYPGTVQGDEALFKAATLYHQQSPRDGKRDLRAGRELFRRLATRPGPPSTYVLWAQQNVASATPGYTERMRKRSDFYLAASAQDASWLNENIPAPSKEMRPLDFVKSVESYVVQVRAVQITSCKNMVADAALSPRPLENLNWLKKRHADDALVQGEVQTAIERVLRKFYSVDLRTLDASAMDGVIASLTEQEARSPMSPGEGTQTHPTRKAAASQADHGSFTGWITVATTAAVLVLISGLLVWVRAKSRRRQEDDLRSQSSSD